jgi:hypothetical protein
MHETLRGKITSRAEQSILREEKLASAVHKKTLLRIYIYIYISLSLSRAAGFGSHW